MQGKQQYISLFFFALGVSVIAFTFYEHGPSKEGQFGYIAGLIALAYGWIRNKIYIRK